MRRTPIAVEPSLIASREYSTWNRRPSGEKVLVGRHCQIRALGLRGGVRSICLGYILDSTVYSEAVSDAVMLVWE